MTEFELRKHKTAFKPPKELGRDFKKPKDHLHALERIKNSWKSRGAEDKPGKNGNVDRLRGKQHAETTGHGIP